MPIKAHHKKNIYISAAVGALILIAGLLSLGIYPVAMVGDRFISARVWHQDFDIAQKFDPQVDSQKAFNQMVEAIKKDELVHKLGIDQNNSEDLEWKYYRTGNEQQYSTVVNTYFSGREKLFKNYVVKPQANDALLRIKFNSDFAANNDAYNKAQNVLTKISTGEKFEDLAKTYSDDKVSGQLGGDLGFVIVGQLIPELEKAVTSSTLGEFRKQIVISRLGYHVLFPVESTQKDGQKVWHVKHILIQTTGYDTWLNAQLQTIGVHRFMTI